MDLKNLLKYKTVLVLLFVVVLNVAVFVLLDQLNAFVHGDLYNYGLVFSYDWAEDFWHYSLSAWAFIMGATALAAFAVIPHYLYSREASRFSKVTGSFVPTLALVFQGLGIYFLSRIDFIVRNTLYNYGISSSFDWGVTYDPIFTAAFGLLTTSLVALIIPAVRTLEIIKVEIRLFPIRDLDKLTPFALIVLSVASAIFLSPILTLGVFGLTLAIYILLKYDSRLFVGTAIILLILSAAFLASGSSAIANGSAIIAYYFLVIGVLGILIGYLREGRKTSDKCHGTIEEQN